MKKTLLFITSLTLGLLVTSCQNDLEEVMQSSTVQDELATTRAEEPNVPTVVPLTGNETEEEVLEALASLTGSRGSISGDYIIGGTEEKVYQVNYPAGTDSLVWVFNRSVLTEVAKGNKWIKVKLVNPSSTTDVTLIAYAYDTGLVTNTYSKSLGINGPRKDTDSSLTIVRSSDSVQVYPFSSGAPFSSYTYYYGYFSCSYPVTITQWDFGGHATILSQYGYNSHFQTDNQQWWLLNIKGTMSPYNVEKTLLTAWLYGQ